LGFGIPGVDIYNMIYLINGNSYATVCDMVFVAGTITTSLPWKEWSALAPPIGCLPAGRDGYTNALL